MAISKKDKKADKFYFSPQARAHFAKEMMNHYFDFDKLLADKRAIRRKFETVGGRTYPVLVAIEYETQEQRNGYVSKFLNGTPYYSFEAATMEGFWKIPFCFWAELREQSKIEESRLWWECNNLEQTRTGRTYEERAREKISEFKNDITKKMKI